MIKVANIEGSEHFSNVGDHFTRRNQQNISLVSGLHVILQRNYSIGRNRTSGSSNALCC